MATTISGSAVTTPLVTADDIAVDTDTIVVDATNNRVGIGTSSPDANLDIESNLPTIRLTEADDSTYSEISQNFGYLILSADAGNAGSGDGILFKVDSADAMRIDSDGNLLVGKTGSAFGTEGVEVRPDALWVTRDSDTPVFLNRETTDGNILTFSKDSSTVGNIGTKSSDLYIGKNESGLLFDVTGEDGIRPFNTTTQVESDNNLDLGSSSARFDDIYATNSTIQTSDRNEKQQIASLTSAEITAAKAISKLFKTFKWNDSVAEKGDSARTHAGVIAQDVEQALTDAGLSAGDYAFFISSTWWETQTDIPAVEAVDAVLDEDGNVVTEAVEAADAYTRTDTYETANEAPEGATQRTRLGIRYPELLAFVGAATEQRLASIEARLDALESGA